MTAVASEMLESDAFKNLGSQMTDVIGAFRMTGAILEMSEVHNIIVICYV